MATVVSFDNTTLLDQEVPIGDLDNNEYSLAQSFTMPSTSPINGIEIYIKKVNTISDQITFRIETDSGTAPTGTLVSAGATGSLSTTNTSYEWVTANFPDVTLTNATKYWIVCAVPNQTAQNRYDWGRDNGNGYAGGNDANTFNGVVWTVNAGSDLFFRVTHIASSSSPMFFGNTAIA